MTNIIFSDEVHKDCDSDDLENILRSLVDENGICRMCGRYRRSILGELHNEKKTSGKLNKWIAIILEKVHPNPEQRAALYLMGIDFDNQNHTLSIHSEPKFQK